MENFFTEVIVCCAWKETLKAIQHLKSFVPRAKQNFGNRPKMYWLILILFFDEVYVTEELIPQKYRIVFTVCVGYHS